MHLSDLALPYSNFQIKIIHLRITRKSIESPNGANSWIIQRHLWVHKVWKTDKISSWTSPGHGILTTLMTKSQNLPEERIIHFNK